MRKSLKIKRTTEAVLIRVTPEVAAGLRKLAFEQRCTLGDAVERLYSPPEPENISSLSPQVTKTLELMIKKALTPYVTQQDLAAAVNRLKEGY